ncbi:hypothetical protein ABUK73_10620 [Agrobacterium sp. BA1120]|uniref:hypothetical protein n=1 Tax=Agrobacterium sp. BA1120 TaxID=3228927 RepID=UPI003369EB05
MTIISSQNSSALLILQKTNSPNGVEQEKPQPKDDLVGIASNSKTKIGRPDTSAEAETKISSAIYSVHHVNVNKLKLDLIDRTGKALGVDQKDYDTRTDFVNAMQRALGKLRIEQGEAAVIALEKELGLDKLGVSIDDVINSASDPEGNDKVTKALKKEAGISDEEGLEDITASLFQPDELGLYGAVKV